MSSSADPPEDDAVRPTNEGDRGILEKSVNQLRGALKLLGLFAFCDVSFDAQ